MAPNFPLRHLPKWLSRADVLLENTAGRMGQEASAAITARNGPTLAA